MTTTLNLPSRELPNTTARNADFRAMAGLLKTQQAHKLDVIVPASSLEMVGGMLAVGGLEPIITADGVFDPNGLYRLTVTADNQLGALFSIPRNYVKLMRSENLGLLDTNVNSWAQKELGKDKPRRVLLRILWGEDPNNPGTCGIVRAVLSDKYGIRDNLDIVIAVVQGMTEGGLSIDDIRSTDLSDDRLYIKVVSKDIEVLSRELTKGYRYFGRNGEDFPIINPGIDFLNSEVGSGAFEIVPFAELQICTNGMRQKVDAFRRVHLGGRLEEGVVAWSDSTRQQALEFTKAQVADSVRTFLSKDYLQKVVDRMEEQAGVEVTDVQETIKVVAKQLRYSEDEADAILNAFIDGGQRTAGGVANAVTAYAQTVEDVDRSYELASSGVEAMAAAVAAQKR